VFASPKKQAESEEGGDGAPSHSKRERQTHRDTEERDRKEVREGGKGGRGWSFVFHLFASFCGHEFPLSSSSFF